MWLSFFLISSYLSLRRLWITGSISSASSLNMSANSSKHIIIRFNYLLFLLMYYGKSSCAEFRIISVTILPF